MDGGNRSTAANVEFDALLAEIDAHNRRYYRDGSPAIGDGDYDALIRRRDFLAEQNPELRRRFAPTVGDDRLEKFEKRTHLRPMLSLNNTYNESELRQFIDRVERASGNATVFAVEPKIDGLATAIIFRGGHFDYALTRGNGAEGDDVSANVRTISGLPMEIPSMGEGIVEVRGEVYIDRGNFLRLNALREEDGLEPFTSARNLAVGSLRLLDPVKAAERRLRFIAYEIATGDEGFQTHCQVLEALKSWGFPTNDHALSKGADETWKCIEEFDRRRGGYPFDTDGAVVKVNDRNLRRNLGSQATAPRWAIAYKFSPERAETILENILLQVGRSGVVTPIADLRPVTLSGATIRSATLHNGDEIARKDLRVGDSVILERAGEVIPAVVGVVAAKRPKWSTPYVFPMFCPACGGNLTRIDGEVARRCLNCDCPPQIARRIQHFASKDAMDIESLGPQRLQQLLDGKLIGSFVDIFRLDFNSLVQLPRVGEKSARKLLSAIENAKTRPLWRLIHGIGIPHIGMETAKALAMRWPSMNSLAKLSVEDLRLCDGIGEIVAASVHKFFSDPRNLALIDQLAALGLSMVDVEPPQRTDGPFAGKIFAITGTFNSMGREDLRSAIEAAGGSVRSSVSSKVDVLLVGDAPGSKLAEAEKLGIQTAGEDLVMGWLDEVGG
ncbi:MAG: NAD-dependent DNA ligase LigA [Puniceicoccales bacterium]|jgi:DNA ligase (NAD+)|nr:NAD-dependent DNA ligase LigA [Puniceicoccales bacterium]